jgi:hypothetical protein
MAGSDSAMPQQLGPTYGEAKERDVCISWISYGSVWITLPQECRMLGMHKNAVREKKGWKLGSP